MKPHRHPVPAPTLRDTSLRPGLWRDRAACTGADPILFDELITRATLTDVREQYCTGCPVRAECLTAGTTGGEYGVWGGELLQQGKIRAPKHPGRVTEHLPTDEEWEADPDLMLSAHRSHQQGSRDPWTVAGNRAFERTRKRAQKARQAKYAPRVHQPCGTKEAYQRHMRLLEEPCEADRDAYNAYQRERRAARNAERAAAEEAS